MTTPHPDSPDLLIAILELPDADAYTRFLEQHPEVLREGSITELRRMSEDPVAGPAIAGVESLLRASAGGDPRQAWESYQHHIAAIEVRGVEFEGSLGEVNEALVHQDGERAIALALELLPEIHKSGLVLMESFFYEAIGRAFMQRAVGDHAENVDAAIEAFREAAIRSQEGPHRASVLMHAGIAFRERVHGDPARNLDQALELFREALDCLKANDPPELWAIVRTNLASTLLACEGEDRVERLREAADLCRAALQYRTPERNGVDWAYTQTNHGFILFDLARLGAGEVSAARQAFEAVISEQHRIAEKWLVGAAHCALGRIERITSQRTEAQQIEAVESEAAERHQRREELAKLERAREHFEAGLPLTTDDLLPTRRGRALDDFAAVLARLDRAEESIEVGREALAIMRPTTAPRECLEIGGRLGDQLATSGEWEESAAAFADALQAAELSFHARLDTAGREDEAGRAGELARWAAIAFARTGRPREAALALESGRTRELRRRLGLGEAEEQRFAELPTELREAFEGASAALGSSPLGDAAAPAGRALQEVLETIRRRPGMEDFATGPRWEDLAAAVEPDWPLVYVNPTPWGTLLLRLSGDGTGEADADALILGSPSALEVYYRLALGHAFDPQAPPGVEPASYLAAAGTPGSADLKRGLEQALPWLGEQICEPLAHWLADAGQEGATLVLCGPICAVPLGAAPWREGAEDVCLLDRISLRYGPSALLIASSRRRAAATEGEARLLALADDSLEAAEAEVAEVASHFNGRTRVAAGADASADFLRSEVAAATHLHIAGHAQAEIFDASETGVILAGELLPAEELPALEAEGLRLAVVSACQSAVTQIVRLPNEVFATSTALLAAGSASVIASLWPVDDIATAMLMTRLYEGMFDACHDPPEALRRAQLWLRELSDPEKADFLDAHPALAAELRRRGERRGRRSAAVTGRPGHPYSHPDYWAAFIAVGV